MKNKKYSSQIVYFTFSLKKYSPCSATMFSTALLHYLKREVRIEDCCCIQKEPLGKYRVWGTTQRTTNNVNSRVWGWDFGVVEPGTETVYPTFL